MDLDFEAARAATWATPMPWGGTQGLYLPVPTGLQPSLSPPHVASGLGEPPGLGIGLYPFTPGPASQSRGALLKSLPLTETQPPQLLHGDIAPAHGRELGLSEGFMCLAHGRHRTLVSSHRLFTTASFSSHFVFQKPQINA